MDLLVEPLDYYLLDSVYPASMPSDNIYRQCLTVYVFIVVGALLLYFIIGGFSYVFFFDRELRKHPKFLKNQERIEIGYALQAIPWIALYSTPIFVGELRGYSKLYREITPETGGTAYALKSVVAFILWNDFWVYLVHRALHTKFLYARVHKVHHLFKIHTPWAALAFTPLDGFSQSVPYHAFVYAFPMHRLVYVLSFIGVQLWTIFIHTHLFITPEWLDPFFNGSAHHSDHHEHFNYNHGLYTTTMDRLFGTYRVPSASRGIGPHDAIRKLKAEGKLGKVETEEEAEERMQRERSGSANPQEVPVVMSGSKEE